MEYKKTNPGLSGLSIYFRIAAVSCKEGRPIECRLPFISIIFAESLGRGMK